MRKIVLMTVTLLFLLASCGKKDAAVRNEGTKSGSYRFAYFPYENQAVSDRQLYNYIFNIVRNKLIYFVQKTQTPDPDPLGMVLELESRVADRPNPGYQEVMQSKAQRGWKILDTDIIPIPNEDIEGYNAGSMDQKVVLTPKASFTVSISGNNATVYVKYWFLQYWNYNFIHYLVKTTNWSVVRTDVIE